MLPDTHPCVFTCVSRWPSSNHRVFAILNKLITSTTITTRQHPFPPAWRSPFSLEWVWSVFRKLFLGQISSDLQMVDGGASGSEGSDISGIDEYIPDHFDGKTDGFRHKFTASRWCCHQKALAWDSAWLSNLFGESDEARFEGSHPNWVTDSGRYLMKMVHHCSSNRQIGMILVAKCSYCICL